MDYEVIWNGTIERQFIASIQSPPPPELTRPTMTSRPPDPRIKKGERLVWGVLDANWQSRRELVKRLKGEIHNTTVIRALKALIAEGKVEQTPWENRHGHWHPSRYRKAR